MTNDELNAVKSLIERVGKLNVVIKTKILKQVRTEALTSGRHLGRFHSDVCEGIYYIKNGIDFFFIDVLNLNNDMTFGLIPIGKDQVIERSYNDYRVRYTLKEIANILTLIESLPVRSNNTDTVAPNPPIYRPLKEVLNIDVKTDHDRDNPYHLRVIGGSSIGVYIKCEISVERLNDPTSIIFSKSDLPNHVWVMGLKTSSTGIDEIAELLKLINDAVKEHHKSHLSEKESGPVRLSDIDVNVHVNKDVCVAPRTLNIRRRPDGQIIIDYIIDHHLLKGITPIIVEEGHLKRCIRSYNVDGSQIDLSDAPVILKKINDVVRDYHKEHLAKMSLNIVIDVTADATLSTDTAVYVNNINDVIYITGKVSIDRLNQTTPIELKEGSLPIVLRTEYGISDNLLQSILVDLNKRINDLHANHLLKIREHQPLEVRVRALAAEGQDSDYLIRVQDGQQDLLVTCTLDVRRLNNPMPIVLTVSNLPEVLVSGCNLNPEELNEILSEINVKARAFHMAWMDKTKVMEKSDKLTEPKTLIVECEISSTIPSGYILKAYKVDKDTLLIACIVSEKRLNQMASLIIPQSEIVGAVKGLFVSTVEMADMATDTIKDQISEWIANPPLTAKEVAKKEIKSMIKQLKRYYKALG